MKFRGILFLLLIGNASSNTSLAVCVGKDGKPVGEDKRCVTRTGGPGMCHGDVCQPLESSPIGFFADAAYAPGFNEVTENFDGSINVNRPRLIFEGQPRHVAAGTYTGVWNRFTGNCDAMEDDLNPVKKNPKSVLGICVLHGKARLVAYRSSVRALNEGKFAVELTANGKYQKKSASEVNWPRCVDPLVVDSVTCADE